MTIRIDDAAAVRGGATAAGAPLVLLLHGFGSSERDLPGIMPHLPRDLAWASLRAPLALGNGGHAWVPITVPGRPDPGLVGASTTAVLDWLDEHVAATTPVIPLGFSQGGLMATQLLRNRPERFAAAVVLAGFTLDGALPGDAELAVARPPVFSGRGDADQVIAADAVARTDAWLPGHVTLTRRTYGGLGHGISAEELADVSAFLDDAVLAPLRIAAAGLSEKSQIDN
jgi:phospholipase/carboxylesterase